MNKRDGGFGVVATLLHSILIYRRLNQKCRFHGRYFGGGAAIGSSDGAGREPGSSSMIPLGYGDAFPGVYDTIETLRIFTTPPYILVNI
jgi:hypothetical protein